MMTACSAALGYFAIVVLAALIGHRAFRKSFLAGTLVGAGLGVAGVVAFRLAVVPGQPSHGWILVPALFLVTGAVSVVAGLLMKAVPPPRFAPGLCQACGYNLRGNTSGRCPECGTACEHVRPAS
jgi:drug/metabolite transporter (DMT)-like permease